MRKPPVHPGKLLACQLEEHGLSAAALSRLLGVPENRIGQIIAQRRNISPDTALRLGKWSGTGPEYWMDRQRDYDLHSARKQIGAELRRITSRSKSNVK